MYIVTKFMDGKDWAWSEKTMKGKWIMCDPHAKTMPGVHVFDNFACAAYIAREIGLREGHEPQIATVK